ncbi:MAG: ATP-binding protein [Bdellovibrio sp.]
MSALCPKNSFLAKTKFLNRLIRYPAITYSRSKIIYIWILFTILFLKPDLIVPGDEDTILALQKISNATEGLPFLNFISKLIRKSLTPKEFDNIILSKSEFQTKASEWGVRTPKNIIIKDVEEAVQASLTLGYPVVLKHDSGYGGSGVFICQNENDVRNHFSIIEESSFSQKLRATLKRLFFVSIFNHDKKISIQQFISGQVGQAPFCSQNGKIFAFNPMLRLHTFPGKTGPASVSQGFENVDIKQFVETVAKKLNYTGFGSLEYMVDEKTGLLYAIELNPRPTPTCHMSAELVNNDLCEAFYNGLNKLPIRNNSFKPYTIAMFPGEKKRDAHSKYLKEAFHDVPHDDPELYRALDPIF